MIKKLRERYRYSIILLKALVKTDFKLRYEGSFLGMLWSALKPLMLFAVMYVVFVRFLKFGGDIPHFTVMLFLGIVFWQFFSEATSQGMQAIVARGDIMRKINIPKYIVVISTTVSALINFGINMVVVLIFAIFNGVQFTWSIFWIIPIIFELFALSLSMAFILSALYVKFRDLTHIWDVVMQAGYFFTPIIYPVSMVLAFGSIGKAFFMNPMAQMIQDARNVVVAPTDTIWNTILNPLVTIIPLVIIVVLGLISSWYFRRASKRFTELV